MGHNKVVVVSIDAMITSDVEVLKTFPEAKAFFDNYAQGLEMLSVYPSLTYPCHVSILTGCYPNRHGIFNNDKFEPDNPAPDWYWYDRYHKVPSMLDLAKKNGFTTASIGWPSTSGANVDYLISKVWTPSAEDEDRVNSPLVKEIYHRHKHLIDGHVMVNLDMFSRLCTCDIIQEFKPDLTLSYFAMMDSVRHKKGVSTELHIDTLHGIAEHLGAIADSCRKAGIFDDTTFILVSDHGQVDVERVFNINVELRKRGYIWKNEEGKTEWKIFSHSTAFGGEIYTKDIDEKEAKSVLESIRKEYPGELERVLNKYEMEKIYHLSGPFDFIVENQQGVAMGRAIEGNVITRPGMDDYKSANATHGHAPEKGDKATFVISGKCAKSGAVVKEASIIDEAPTIMKIFGLDMDGVDGRPLDELLEVK